MKTPITISFDRNQLMRMAVLEALESLGISGNLDVTYQVEFEAGPEKLRAKVTIFNVVPGAQEPAGAA